MSHVFLALFDFGLRNGRERVLKSYSPASEKYTKKCFQNPQIINTLQLAVSFHSPHFVNHVMQLVLLSDMVRG